MKNQRELSHRDISSCIFTFRDLPVMIDRDLAHLYNVETRILNQAVKRNEKRFPERFRFQLSPLEFEEWKSQIVISNDDKMGLRRPPFVFTEQGVAMLSSVLKSETAISISIQIIDAFVEMRRAIMSNSILLSRLNHFEIQLAEHDKKFQQIFNRIEQKKLQNNQGIFYNGELFDAYSFISDIIRSVKKKIIIIDNYIDDTILTMLSKRKKRVSVTIYTRQISRQLKLDISKYNEQYENIDIKVFTNSHDRFVVIDRLDLFHIGASLKDLGKKWFAFSKMNSFINQLLDQLESN